MASSSAGLPQSSSPAYVREERTRPAHIGQVFFLGVLMLLFVGYLAYCVVSWGARHFQTTDEKRVLERQKILADRNAEDYKLLHDAPSWFKKDKGAVRVPINQAMELTIADLSKIKPHATDIPVTAQAPNAAPQAPDKGAASPTGNQQVNPSASQPTSLSPTPPPAPAPSPAPGGSPAGALDKGSAGPGTAPGGTVLPSATPTPPAAPAPSPAGSKVIPGDKPQPALEPTPAIHAAPGLDQAKPGATPGGTPA